MPTIRFSGPGPAGPMCASPKRSAMLRSPPIRRGIQTAFREVSDALARRGTINDSPRLKAKQEAAADNYMLSDARYREGIDDFLSSLDAQRSYYLAQQQLVLKRLIAAVNLVNLYEALGGDLLYPPTT